MRKVFLLINYLFFPSLFLSDRYRNLSRVSHQERFLEVQLFLLESFISRLNLEAEESSFAPASSHYCSVLNASDYIRLILEEWSEQMACYKCIVTKTLLCNDTVEPLLSGQLLKSWKYSQLNTTCINKTPIKRPPLLSNHGHLLVIPKKVFYCFLPLLSGGIQN